MQNFNQFFLEIQEKHSTKSKEQKSESNSTLIVKEEPVWIEEADVEFPQIETIECITIKSEFTDSSVDQPLNTIEKPAKSLMKRVKKPNPVRSTSKDDGEDEFDEIILGYCKMNCEFCSEDCGTFQKLKQHCKDVHQEGGYAICCSKKFNRYQTLLEHVKRHENPNIHQCTHCSQSFKSKRSLKMHENRRHKINTYKCDRDGCDREYSAKASLDFHIRNVHEILKQNLECDFCGKM